MANIKKMKAAEQPFTRLNYLLIAGCCLLIIVGFLLMLGGGSSVEGGFNPDIFSTRRIIIGPALAFLGFLLMAFAILADPEKSKKKNKKASATEIKAQADENKAQVTENKAPDTQIKK